MSHSSANNQFYEIRRSASAIEIYCSGNWHLENAQTLDDIAQFLPSELVPSGEQPAEVKITTSDVDNFDTSGAFALEKLKRILISNGHQVEIVEANSERRILFAEVAKNFATSDELPGAPKDFLFLGALGSYSIEIFQDIVAKVQMLGQVMVGLGQILIGRRKLRGTALVHHIDKAGLGAVPIIILMSFMTGIIIAQQMAFNLRYYGAEITTVDLVGILVFRELGVLLAAIMVAGRSGSSFTSEIGAMKMREEVDALRVIGMSAIDVLVLPRVLALLIALPALTVVSNMSALLGGGLVTWLYIDVPPMEFISRLREAVWLETLFVGFIKAPFMAFIIAIIACSEGFAVRGSAESLGQHATSSVVKSIFMVIVIDGIFAVFFAMLDY